MSKSSYEQITDGEWIDWTDRVDLACCDCGLVHTLTTRLHNGKLQIHFERNNPATAALRRHHDHPAKVRRKKG